MPIELSKEDKQQALASLQRYCEDELEVELSDLQVAMLLEFVLKEIGPSVYNAGLATAEAFLRDRLADMDATCHEQEFTYWPKGSSVRRK